ncbi:MAG: BON domain-containing protein [Caldilineaceae bacterium]
MRIPFFTKRFDDSELDQCVMTSLESDGLVDVTRIAVQSSNGIVTIQGQTRNIFEKKRAGNIALQGLEASGLRYQEVIDNISIG